MKTIVSSIECQWNITQNILYSFSSVLVCFNCYVAFRSVLML